MFVRKLIIALVFNAVALGGPLFAVADTWHWWRAWVLVAVVVEATAVVMLTVLRQRPGLLKERFRGTIQKGQPWLDRLVILPFLLGYAAVLIVAPKDVFQLHLFAPPGRFVSTLGMALVIVGYWIIARVFQENEFAAPAVKHQKERQHVVVDTGPYAIVRHPMYVGVILFVMGIPLWLESYAATLVALFPSTMLLLRILVEERFLRRELAGYEAYTKTVRYRLVPHVW